MSEILSHSSENQEFLGINLLIQDSGITGDERHDIMSMYKNDRNNISNTCSKNCNELRSELNSVSEIKLLDKVIVQKIQAIIGVQADGDFGSRSAKTYFQYCKTIGFSGTVKDFLTLHTLEENGIELSQEQLNAFRENAKQKLYEFINARFSSLSIKEKRRMYLGPSLDGSRLYTAGNIKWSNKNLLKKSNKAYWDQASLENEKEALLNTGFPTISPAEMREITTIGYEARRDVESERSDLFGVAKHFPGGDHRLVETHTTNIHYDIGNSYVEESMGAFRKVISSENPPSGIMLSLASYEKEYFPGIDNIIERDQNKYPHLKGVNFSDIPASLNPYLITYLKEDMGYNGLIIPDWIGGMEGCDSFINSLDIPFTKHLAIKKIYISLISGNNFVTGLAGTDAIHTMQSSIFKGLNDYPKYKEALEENLKISIDNIFNSTGEETPDHTLDVTSITGLLMTERERPIYLNPETGKISNSKKIGFTEEFTAEKYILEKKLPDILSSPENKKVFDAIMGIGLSQNDVWDRSGVQALVYRIEFVKSVYTAQTGKKLNIKGRPLSSKKEDEWIKSIMKDKNFRSIYDIIDWREVFSDKK